MTENSDLCESNGGGGEGAGVVVIPDPVRVLDGHLGKQVSLVLSERIHQVQSKHTGWSRSEILEKHGSALRVNNSESLEWT